jgi:hypothetical protein
MGVTTTGRDYWCAAAIGNDTGTAGQALTTFNNANAALGVGDSSTAFAVGQNDLQAATNKLRKGMQATYPSVAANVITAQSQFASAEANWAWAEVGFFNSATAATGTMMSRVVASLGTKASGSVWTLTYTLTMAVS